VRRPEAAAQRSAAACRISELRIRKRRPLLLLLLLLLLDGMPPKRGADSREVGGDDTTRGPDPDPPRLDN
jgi:hypothetical protein